MKERNEKKAKGAGGGEPILRELVEQARSGDQAAFAELYEQTSAELYRSVRSMVRDEDLAWDILQDSYVRAWRGLDKLETSGSFLPWLRRIAVNVTAAEMAQKRALTFSDLARDEDEGAAPDIPDLNIDNQPELALDRKETSRLVREILAGLPEEQQLIVGMHYYEDMTVNAIAETLQVSPGTVKAQLFKGRKKIEAGVRALEKQGVKLYGLSPLPFLLALLRRLEPAARTEKQVLDAVLAQAPTGAATVTAMTAGQAFLHGLGAKLLAGGLAIAVLVGGKLGYDALKKGNTPRIGDPELTTAATAAGEDSSEPATTLAALPEASAESTAPTAPTEGPILGSTQPTQPADEYAGDCGVSLTWRFDPDTGVLTLEGSGAMYDYGSRATLADEVPWASFQSSIAAIRFPEGIASIGAEAFRGCEALTEAAVPAGVTVIGDAAFSGCKNLASVTIPEGLVSLGARAFHDCDSLLTVRLPRSLTTLGAGAFADCGSLVSAVLPKGSLVLEDGLFDSCEGLRFLQIPEGVTAVGSRTFSGCTELTAAVIPETANSVGANAFSGCEGLVSAVILNRAAAIDDDAFDGCDNLTIYGYPYSTASIYAAERDLPFLSLEDLGETPIPGYREDLSFLSEGELSWRTETVRNDLWITRSLDLYPDGSLWYREGELFSRSALYLDGLWQAEADGSLLLTLWKSPYNSWSRPEGYRVTAADAPADSRTARFSCQPTEAGLVLRQQYEQGFSDDKAGTRLEFYASEQAVSTIDAEALRALEDRDSAEWERLIQSQNAYALNGYRSRIGFRGIAKAGDRYAARVVRMAALTVSEAELSRAAQTARITLLGQEFFYGATAEGEYGSVYRLRPNGRVNWSDWYRVKRVGDRYFFAREEAGVTTRLETAAETCWLWLEPDTPIVVSSDGEGLPRTLEEWGSVSDRSCAPLWEETTGKLYIWIDAE